MKRVDDQQPATPMDSERSVLTELLRLYDWRFELARMEKDAADPGGVSRLLIRYGREKKAAWEAARRILSVQSESAPIRHPQSHDEAKKRIVECVREIEMIADSFGYDPFEWLAA